MQNMKVTGTLKCRKPVCALCSPRYPIRRLLFEVKSVMLIADIELLLRANGNPRKPIVKTF